MHSQTTRVTVKRRCNWLSQAELIGFLPIKLHGSFIVHIVAYITGATVQSLRGLKFCNGQNIFFGHAFQKAKVKYCACITQASPRCGWMVVEVFGCFLNCLGVDSESSKNLNL
jgi:hypothetical protein